MAPENGNRKMVPYSGDDYNMSYFRTFIFFIKRNRITKTMRYILKQTQLKNVQCKNILKHLYIRFKFDSLKHFFHEHYHHLGLWLHHPTHVGSTLSSLLSTIFTINPINHIFLFFFTQALKHASSSSLFHHRLFNRCWLDWLHALPAGLVFSCLSVFVLVSFVKYRFSSGLSAVD